MELVPMSGDSTTARTMVVISKPASGRKFDKQG
jgi:hypothetical protein